MPRNTAALVAQLLEATEAGFRGRLLARGQAQSMIRRDGDLPDDSQNFGPYLDRDLLDYGYSLMSTSLRIIEAMRSSNDDISAEQRNVARNAFLQASFALEAATRNADPQIPELSFHRLIAGAASHMAGYAARAFSLIQTGRATGRLSPMELTLADLITRNLGPIEERTRRLRASPDASDEALTAALSGGTPRDEQPGATDGSEYPSETKPPSAQDPETLTDLGPITLLLSEHYLAAVSSALFAITFGRDAVFAEALEELRLGEAAADDIAAPGPWWVFRLTRYLIDDLYETSIRKNLPVEPPEDYSPSALYEAWETDEEWEDVGGETLNNSTTKTFAHPEELWDRLRRTYIASLAARKRAEIDLWPSQLHVINRIFAGRDNLVVALPTGAGKTRIAELAILRCLAARRRAVYVTPLRALSAQTERILQGTFAPLGARVSSLYGSMGVNDVDEDALRSSNIVIATPEKLDFALRSDPTVLDDVGVIILDEGHMIGPGEREVRYEAQIQRLLRRADSDTRRIICLSAVFPENEELDDFVDWITDGATHGLHKEDWRPTRQQFGLVEWRAAGHARLSITVGRDQPFIPRYFETKLPTGKRRKAFPQDQNEMTVATAWRLVQEDQTVLIYCPLRVSVGTLASLIVKLHAQGLIESVMPDGVDISDAVTIGTEWFGSDHDILKCLRLGVAVHHGALPGPFRREIETLLDKRILKITLASPTLAQGLNLPASAVLFSSLYRNKSLLTGAEFANVIGRAGRAFVDTEGLVLYPMYEPSAYKRSNWIRLVEGERTRALQSGLIAIGNQLLERMVQSTGLENLTHFLDYLTGQLDWSFPSVPGEDFAERAASSTAWQSDLSMLDTAILSVVGDEEAAPEQIIQVLADALRDSLWERQMRRLDPNDALRLRTLVERRAQFLWDTSTPAQRRGWYLAGLGANPGSELALAAATIVDLTYRAEVAMTAGDADQALTELEHLASQVFTISTFAPTINVNDWQGILAHWLAGDPLSAINEKQIEVAQFIESDIIYRLVWGLEAARVYEQAQGNLQADLIDGSATAALEAGTLSRAAAILLRSGFDHRSAAIEAVTNTDAAFGDVVGMRAWIDGLDPDLADDPEWPTPSSRRAWVDFNRRLRLPRRRRWGQFTLEMEEVEWTGEVPAAGEWLRVTDDGSGTAGIWSPGFERLATVRVRLNHRREGIIHATRDPEGVVTLRYRGPDDWLLASDSRRN